MRTAIVEAAGFLAFTAGTVIAAGWAVGLAAGGFVVMFAGYKAGNP